jgi:hypothetical protein
MTDQLASDVGIRKDYAHHVINHAETYVGGTCIPTALRISGAY